MRTRSPSHVAWSEGRLPLVRCSAIHQMNRGNYRNGLVVSGYDDSTINIVLVLLLLLLLLAYEVPVSA